jgi:hypothetical protein
MAHDLVIRGGSLVDGTGSEAAPSHLVVSENWYKDWTAMVDGKPGVVRRADHALLSEAQWLANP